MIVIATDMMSGVSNEGFDRRGAIERIVGKLQESDQITLIDVEELAMWQELMKAYKEKESVWDRIRRLFSE